MIPIATWNGKQGEYLTIPFNFMNYYFQQQQRTDTNNQTPYVKEESRPMLTASHPTMHSRSQNGAPNALPSCNGCRELKR